AILRVHTSQMPLGEDVVLERLAEELESYTGADIEALCHEAGLLALREDPEAQKILNRHFKGALDTVHGSIDEIVQRFYDDIEKRLKHRIIGNTSEKHDFL
ncbi:MAG TPA: hypothetical protein VJ044_08310, partial [Candidatus Hodarchaeales archaeon]|nr:hypothetical protein [Candidatus Hodarchaeales archaeon]